MQPLFVQNAQLWGLPRSTASRSDAAAHAPALAGGGEDEPAHPGAVRLRIAQDQVHHRREALSLEETQEVLVLRPLPRGQGRHVGEDALPVRQGRVIAVEERVLGGQSQDGIRVLRRQLADGIGG